MYDIIGDIHGQYGKLKALLVKLKYVNKDGLWIPPNGRKAVFLGDLIDRGPDQVKVMATVKKILNNDHGYCILGNHELNAIGYATPHPHRPGEYLRPHTEKNRLQHQEFLDQVGEGSEFHHKIIEWFKILPVRLELKGIRVVHAWWHEPYLQELERYGVLGGKLDNRHFEWALDRHGGHPLYDIMEGLCKGLEIELPDDIGFVDPSGVVRRHARTKWWLPDAPFLNQVVLMGGEVPLDLYGKLVPETFKPEPITGKPVFVGHYWMKGKPSVLTPKVACVDYSAGKGGPLVAYRWNGESELHDGGFVSSH
jgi:hypothetical protein